MDNWEKFLNNLLGDNKQEFDSFVEQLAQDWQKSTSQLEENLNNFATEIENVFTEELSQFVIEFDTLIEDFFRIIIDENFINQDDENGNNSSYGDFIVWFEEQKIQPNSNTHPACIGCANYHGRVYNGNLLVCGMHPYGWDDENCPDWEAENKN